MIDIVQSGMDIPRAGLVGLWELHGAEQGLGLVRDISGYGEAAHGTFVGRPAMLFGGSAAHYLAPATEDDHGPTWERYFSLIFDTYNENLGGEKVAHK